MKIRIIFCLIYLFGYYSTSFCQDSALNKTLSIQFKGENISTALELIGRETEISFVYNSDIIVDDVKINSSFDKAQLRNVLENILKGTDIVFKEVEGQIYFYRKTRPSKVFEKPVEADRTITGAVIDADTREPMPYAHVFINNSTIGTYTGKLGEFALKPPEKIFELIVSYIGYDRMIMKIDLSKNNAVNIVLKPSEKQLKEVVVTAKKDKNRKKYLKLFTKEFLGFSIIARKCRILNPAVIEFELGESILKAKASQPIKVENQATGYVLDYYLEEFSLNLDTKMPKYYGYCLFHEKDTNNYVVKRMWNKNRIKAYNGSLNHFVKSVLLHQIQEQGFLVDDEKKISVGFDISKGTHFIHLKDEVKVTYLNEYESLGYASWKKRGTARDKFEMAITENPKNQVTMLKSFDSTITVDRNFQVLNQFKILQKGYMGWERMAEALPIEYNPSN